MKNGRQTRVQKEVGSKRVEQRYKGRGRGKGTGTGKGKGPRTKGQGVQEFERVVERTSKGQRRSREARRGQRGEKKSNGVQRGLKGSKEKQREAKGQKDEKGQWGPKIQGRHYGAQGKLRREAPKGDNGGEGQKEREGRRGEENQKTLRVGQDSVGEHKLPRHFFQEASHQSAHTAQMQLQPRPSQKKEDVRVQEACPASVAPPGLPHVRA